MPISGWPLGGPLGADDAFEETGVLTTRVGLTGPLAVQPAFVAKQNSEDSPRSSGLLFTRVGLTGPAAKYPGFSPKGGGANRRRRVLMAAG